ncbi:hypothetical protein FACS189413_07350 [Bacteroidia bacterium]|nr:hypothetical protein FACS189413_07350 [Bacteroidia bacterium]
MKKIVLAIAVLMSVAGVKAQEFSVGADVVSSYLWRGQYLGGTAIQPGLSFSAAGFSIGAWSSVDLINISNVKEFDLSIGYEIAGISVGITDYYIATQGDAGYFNYDGEAGSAHTLEATIGYTLPIESLPLSLSWSTNFYGSDGLNNDGKTAYSSYFEVAYPFSVKDISLNAAVGITPWATSFYGNSTESGFNVINLALTASKEIKIADFTIPAFAQIVVNPRTEDAFLVFGVSF